jgi:hypothetical protein
MISLSCLSRVWDLYIGEKERCVVGRQRKQHQIFKVMGLVGSYVDQPTIAF